jgi:hypothetical protein
MKWPARWTLPVLLLAIALVALQPVFAFQYPLSSMDIREAYFLGKGTRQENCLPGQIHASVARADQRPLHFGDRHRDALLDHRGACGARASQLFRSRRRARVSRKAGRFPCACANQLDGFLRLASCRAGRRSSRVHLEFDSEKIDPSTPATVDVVTPDGQDVQTTFDLAELR